jgi:hypothetical protein
LSDSNSSLSWPVEIAIPHSRSCSNSKGWVT